MNKLKQKLITFLTTNFAGSVMPAKNGNGIKVYADISADLAKIEQLAKACELSVRYTEAEYHSKTGAQIAPASAWIGKPKSTNFTEADYLANL